jgi:hypothetical protein
MAAGAIRAARLWLQLEQVLDEEELLAMGKRGRVRRNGVVGGAPKA